MAFLATPNAALCEIKYLWNDVQIFTNSLWFTRSNFSQADLDSLAELLDDFAVSEVTPWLSSGVDYQEVVCTDQRSVGGLQSIGNGGFGTAGGRTGNVDDLATSLVVTLRTNRIGRAFRGRNYVRGLSHLDVADNEVVGAVSDGVSLAYSNLIGAAFSEGWTWVIRTSQVDGVPQDPALTTPITSALVRTRIVGHQRLTYRRP